MPWSANQLVTDSARRLDSSSLETLLPSLSVYPSTRTFHSGLSSRVFLAPASKPATSGVISDWPEAKCSSAIVARLLPRADPELAVLLEMPEYLLRVATSGQPALGLSTSPKRICLFDTSLP